MSIKETIRNWLLEKLGGTDNAECMRQLTMCASEQFKLGDEYGRRQARVEFAFLPMPFTADQLQGREYGTFITPAGFMGTVFGECSVPAPGQHGYEQRALYAARDAINAGGDITCHRPEKFANPGDSDALVPVIVTVLR